MSIKSFRVTFECWLNGVDGRLGRARFGLVIAVGYVLFTLTYVSINEFSVGRKAHTLFLPGEERLPFLPIFEYLYALSYFVGVIFLVTIRDAGAVLRLIRATSLTLLVAYVTYLLFPVWMERPHLERDSVHTWLLSLSYLDRPYNHFPSLHVALGWLAVFAGQVSNRSRVGLSILMVGISVSTLFVKQHYFVDVIAGFALAGFAWRVTRAADSR